MIALGLNEGMTVVLEDCFELPKVTYFVLFIDDPIWDKLPMSAIDDIKQSLTRQLEEGYVVKMGQTFPVTYEGKTYTLTVDDILGETAPGRERRIPAGITKFTEVKVDFLTPRR